MLKFNFFFFSLYKLQFLKGIFLHFSVNICDTEQILFILWDSFYIKFTQQWNYPFCQFIYNLNPDIP